MQRNQLFRTVEELTKLVEAGKEDANFEEVSNLALQIVAFQGDISAADHLISMGCDLWKLHDGKRAIECAIEGHKVEFMAWALMANRAALHRQRTLALAIGRSITIAAVTYQSTKCLQWILHRADFRELLIDFSACYDEIAAAWPHLDFYLILAILRAGFPVHSRRPSDDHPTPQFGAYELSIIHDRRSFISQLRPAKEYPDPISMALHHGASLELIKYLTKSDWNPDSHGAASLRTASMQGNLPVLIHLANSKASLAYLPSKEMHPLSIACVEGHRDLAEWIWTFMDQNRLINDEMALATLSQCFNSKLTDFGERLLNRVSVPADRYFDLICNALRSKLFEKAEFWLIVSGMSIVPVESYSKVFEMLLESDSSEVVYFVLEHFEGFKQWFNAALWSDCSHSPFLEFDSPNTWRALLDACSIMVPSAVDEASCVIPCYLLHGLFKTFDLFEERCGTPMTSTRCGELFHLCAARKPDRGSTRYLLAKYSVQLTLIDEAETLNLNIVPRSFDFYSALNYRKSNGESAAPVAAAIGNIECFEALLEAGARTSRVSRPRAHIGSSLIQNTDIKLSLTFWQRFGAQVFSYSHVAMALQNSCFHIFHSLLRHTFPGYADFNCNDKRATTIRMLNLYSEASKHRSPMSRFNAAMAVAEHAPASLNETVGFDQRFTLTATDKWKRGYALGLVGVHLNGLPFEFVEDESPCEGIMMKKRDQYPVFGAALQGESRTLKHMYQHGADMNRTYGPKGETLLMAATQADSIQSVKFLLSIGCSPATESLTGKKAIAWAKLDSPVKALLERFQ